MPPARPSTEQLVRNQILLREVNERLVEVLKAQNLDFSTDGDRGADGGCEQDFICECSRDECTDPVSLTVEEYEAVRSSPTVFVVHPGHETPEVEETLLTNERYSLVEKKVFAELAETSDPRAG
jgi:hypothetical protein